MQALAHRSKLVSLTLALIAAMICATAPALADEKTEKGVALEFWKGHFDRNAGPFREWDNRGLRALPRGAEPARVSGDW
jgi:hypothetical protein